MKLEGIIYDCWSAPTPCFHYFPGWPHFVNGLQKWVLSMFLDLPRYITIIVFAVIRVIGAIFLRDTLDAAHNDAEHLVAERSLACWHGLIFGVLFQLNMLQRWQFSFVWIICVWSCPLLQLVKNEKTMTTCKRWWLANYHGWFGHVWSHHVDLQFKIMESVYCESVLSVQSKRQLCKKRGE